MLTYSRLDTITPPINLTAMTASAAAMSIASLISPTRYKLYFFVPPTDLQACKDAIFAVGAGTYPGSKYSHCCFEVRGTEQFRSAEGAAPHLGKLGKIGTVEEVKVEVVCVGREVLRRAVRELKRVHPYEDPVVEVFRMEDIEEV